MAKKKKPVKAPAIDVEVIEAEIMPVRTEAEHRLQILNTHPLETAEHVKLFSGLLVEIRKQRDALEEQRTSITKPMNAAKKAVDALFKPVRELYDAMDATITKRLAERSAAQTATQTKALAAVAEGSRDSEVLDAAHTEADDTDGLIPQVGYEFIVYDESAIPRAFLAFDEGLALQYTAHNVKEGKPIPEIPGVEIKEVTTYKRKPGA